MLLRNISIFMGFYLINQHKVLHDCEAIGKGYIEVLTST